jgi:hypothetical protein
MVKRVESLFVVVEFNKTHRIEEFLPLIITFVYLPLISLLFLIQVIFNLSFLLLSTIHEDIDKSLNFSKILIELFSILKITLLFIINLQNFLPSLSLFLKQIILSSFI